MSQIKITTADTFAGQKLQPGERREPCPNCKGRGYNKSYQPLTDLPATQTCILCRGSGRVILSTITYDQLIAREA